jgi:hypothetical protein
MNTSRRSDPGRGRASVVDDFEGCDASPRSAGATRESQHRIDGIVIGRLVALREDGQPLVDFPGNPTVEPQAARSTTTLDGASIGSQAALMFEAGDPKRPVVLGPIVHPGKVATDQDGSATRDHAHADRSSVTIERDSETVTLSAQKQIVLRCGKASITLTRSGKVLIRGAHLVSRSSGVNRIYGGSVQLN